MRESRGRSSEMSLRLCSRAPRMMSFSCTCESSIPCSVNVSRSNKRSQPYRSQASRRAADLALFAPSHAAPTVVLDEPMPDPRLVELLDSGTRRLVRCVDAIPDDQWIRPSLLPGWSRSHVVAHLTLNAEGLSGALEGV